MRLVRFISEKELLDISSGITIEPKKDAKVGRTTLFESNVLFFLDLEDAEKYMDISGAIGLDEIDDHQRIMFYSNAMMGIVNDDFAVVVNVDEGRCIIGEGIYAHPGWLYAAEGVDVDRELAIKEVGLVEYSIDDVTEIWINNGGDFEIYLSDN